MCDRVRGIARPNALLFADLAPAQVAGGAHHPLEDLGKVPRVQDDEPHPLEDPRLDAIHRLVGHVPVSHVPPPGEDVGLGEDRLREAVVGLVQGGGAYGHVGVGAQELANLAVDALGVHLGHGLVGLFVAELVPDGDANLLCHRAPLPCCMLL